MVFSSPIFLFLFLPIFLFGYYLLYVPVTIKNTATTNRFFLTLSNIFILTFSLIFYFWGEAWLVLVMLSSTLLDYFCGLLIGGSSNQSRRKIFLVISITFNLSLLVFFKYINFGIDNFNAFFNSFGLTSWQVKDFMEVSLPLGISFYTFQSMSYTIDVYRKNVEPTRNFFDFACFVTMFPQLVAGPIVRYRDIATQIIKRSVNHHSFSSGCLRFIFGLGKKVLIANTLAVPADMIFAIPTDGLTTGLAWLGITCYTLQIYFDFSGYSDMAIGLGRMLGFTFPENFNYPYSSKSIKEFWRRWHISLSNWFRDYLYIPLGGSRVRPGRNYFNLILVFLLCGLWHGASWTFVLWGLYHGAFLVAERLGLYRRIEHQLPTVLRHFYTLLAVMGGWVLFRSETFTYALGFYSALIGLDHGSALQFNVPMYFTMDVMIALVAGSLLSFPMVPWLIGWKNKIHMILSTSFKNVFHLTYSGMKITIVLTIFFLSAMSLSSGAYNPFIYYRF